MLEHIPVPRNMLHIPQTKLHRLLIGTIDNGIEQYLMLHNPKYPVHHPLTCNPLTLVNLFELSIALVDFLELY